MLTFSNAQAQVDPFAVLFGDTPANVIHGDNSGSAHEDNIRLLALKLRDQPLIDVVSSYEVKDDICVDVIPVFEALNFPISIADGVMSGWIHDAAQTIDINLSTRDGVISGKSVSFSPNDIQQTDTDWCFALKTLTRLTHIDFTYQASTLSITATPREILPIEAKLERARLRASYLMETETLRPNYAKIDTPYQWLSMPTADIIFDASTAQSGRPKYNLSFDMAGDFMKMTAHARTVTNNASGMSQTRFTLSRTSEHDDQLGLLKARQFSIGDISAPSLPLIEKSENGFGAIISNAPLHTPNLFDTTDIRGALPMGWEAELYQNERLVDFSDEPDSNGDYVFSDIPLTLGYNRVVVKLYGPYGEVKERVISQFVGGEQCPEDELRYIVGIITPRGLGETNDNSSSAQNSVLSPALDTQSPYLLASAEYGLTKFLSARLDATHHYKTANGKAAFSILGSSDTLYGGVRVATDGGGLPAIESFAQKRFGARTSLSAKWVNYGDLVSDYSGQGANRLQSAGLLRLDSQLGAIFKNMPIQARLDWQKRDNGDAALSAQAIMSSQYKGARWSHALKYSHASSEGRLNNSQFEGDFIASKTVQNMRLRAGLNYTLDGAPKINNMSLSAQRSLKSDMLFQASMVYDMQANAAGFESVISKPFDKVNTSFRAGLSQNGDWHAGVNLTFAIYSPKDTLGYRLAPPGLSRTGAIRLQAFEDIDVNGRYTQGDIPTENVKYIVANSLRSETSAANGTTFMTGLEPYMSTDIELQVSSLDDPFLRPARLGRAVNVRPGQVIDVPFSLLTTGDIDGVVSLSKDGHDTPLAGVRIEAVDNEGVVLATSQSEYDGYFYIDEVPATQLSIRISQDDLEMVGGQSEIQTLTLTTSEPSQSGVNLIITH